MSKAIEKLKNKSEDQQYLLKLRHTCEHILHQAIKELYPSIHLALGPATDEGYYFDFDTSPDGRKKVEISEDDFPKIEAKMKEIVKANLPMTRMEVSVKDARDMFADNPYKQEWIDAIEKKGELVTVYWTGDPGKNGSMVDLCAGPHVESTGEVKAFKLLKIAGAYWHGDEKNKMLTRIYGTAFPSKEELDAYLFMQEEAKKRDHRKLGKELDLFSFSDLVGSGMPLYSPKGALIRRLLMGYVEELQSKQGYMQVHTPQIAKAELFKRSGHYDKYKDDMFRVVSNYSDEEFFLKPMNCPQHTQIYACQPRSYRDLPLRITDFAMLYRDEKPGELNGLARVRSFSTDDCHIFCREDQVNTEVDLALSMTRKIMETFGFKYRYRLSTRDPEHQEKYLGDPKVWDKLEAWAVEIMQRNGIEYYDGPGEAAFYGPKMDLMATDALGREWQLSTVQIDMVQPERFELEYVGDDGAKHRPVMIHRAILGSAERAMMVLIEHFAGAFPTWLAPVQVVVVPISQDQDDYAQKVLGDLLAAGIRAENSNESESMQNRIRKAEGLKIPYMLVVGNREKDEGSVAVRARGNKNQGTVPLPEFITQVKQEIESRAL